VYPIDAKKWTNVIKLWLILAFIINIFGIYQIVARAYELPLAWIQFNNVSLAGRDGVMDEAGVNQLSLRYGDFFRATSIFSEPSALGAFNIFILSFLVLPIIQKRVAFFKSRFVIIIFIIASIACLLLTFSMTGAIGFFMLFASVVVFEKFMRLKTIIKTSIVVILIVIIADTSVSTYTHLSVIELFQRRITGLMNYGTRDVEKDVTPGESAYSRITSGTNSVKIWQDYPITGIGLGLTSSNKKYEIGFSDFSVLAALAEMGLIGFISFNVMFLALFVICLRFIRTRAKSNNFSNDQQRMMGIIFYIMLVEFLINFISGNNIIGIGLWIPVAIVFSTVNNFYIGTSDNVRTISLVKVPLKYTFAKNLAKYYESKNDKT